jgi:Immunoglobulin-like domain of bacterial spore germination
MTGNSTNDSDFERQLRESLRRDADRISPRDKRTEILAMVHDAKVTQHSRRWVIPLAAAASVALIGAIAWGASTVNGQPVGQQAPVAPAASSSSSPSAASSSPATGATSQVALPAYFVGGVSPTGDKFGLYREFVKASVPVDATPAQKAKAAVALAMNAQRFASFEPYIQPWSGQSVKDVTMTPSLITITVSGSSAAGLTSEQTRLAVQELVWTAQAAVGQGTIPVKFVVADGSSTLFGSYPTGSTYNRPAKDVQYQDLAPIWITAPERGHVFKAGTPVEVTGESCAFEATTQWELATKGAVAKAGTTTATSGCPTRGTWKVDLGVLTPGDYSFRMFEVSMQDGKEIAESSKPFTVR